MRISIMVEMDGPDSIGICGGVMDYAGMDECGNHLWIYERKGVKSSIEILSEYHTVRVGYKGKTLYEDEKIRNEDDLFIAIEFAVKNLEIRYKADKLFMEEKE